MLPGYSKELEKQMQAIGIERPVAVESQRWLVSHEAIDELFLAILQDHTAGDPMNEQVKWTNLSVEAIKRRLKKAEITVSRNIVRKLLKKHDYVKRKVLKKSRWWTCQS